MTKHDEIVTTDLANFGFRELRMAADLLNAYCEGKWAGDNLLGDGVRVHMNRNSGCVFLSDEDFNVAMMNGDKLEMHFSCPECGNEGFAEDIDWDSEKGRCGKCKDHD